MNLNIIVDILAFLVDPSISDVVTQVGSFLTSALGWMTQIFTWMVGEPVILFFMAIGLAGVMFRWARKTMHF